MYAQGVSTRDIQVHLLEFYGTNASPDLISEITDGVKEQAERWQQRPLERLYPVLYLDALLVRLREGGTVVKKAVYVAFGTTIDGTRDVLGLCLERI